MTRQAVEFPPGEEWIEVVGHPQYLISTLGRVYSVRGRRIMSRYWAEHAASAVGGQWHVHVYPGGGCRAVTLPVAHHALLAFRGPPPTGAHSPHYLDGDRRNVAIDNLEWRPRPGGAQGTPARMRELAPLGYAASPAAQAVSGRRWRPVAAR